MMDLKTIETELKKLGVNMDDLPEKDAYLRAGDILQRCVEHIRTLKEEQEEQP